MKSLASQENIPSYVRPEQVVDFDYFHDSRVGNNLHLDLAELHSNAPDIFYSPRQGGFWVVTRYDIMAAILQDPQHFSAREMDIPKSNSPNIMIPLNLDPPDNMPYRLILMRHFGRKQIAALEPKIRMWANRLIDGVIDEGKCEFSSQVASRYPVSIFMEFMGLPLHRLDEFRGIALEYFGGVEVERRIELQGKIIAIMKQYFDERRLEPKDDVISGLVKEELKGRALSQYELDSMGWLLFVAGMDTVVNSLAFTFHNLAINPDIQERLAGDPDAFPEFVEESLRRFSIIQQTRIVRKDIDFHGASFREGDMVLCSLPLAGLDERRNPEPAKFDIDRTKRSHLAFSIGPHTCAGEALARAEMRILAQEWIRRIPKFSLRPGSRPQARMGAALSLKEINLEWVTA